MIIIIDFTGKLDTPRWKQAISTLTKGGIYYGKSMQTNKPEEWIEIKSDLKRGILLKCARHMGSGCTITWWTTEPKDILLLLALLISLVSLYWF